MRKMISWVLAAFLIAGCSESGTDWPSRKFAESKWRQADEAERYVYVNDLLNSGILIGKSHSEVTEMLGNPSSTSLHGDRYFYIVKLGGDGFDQVFILDVRFGEKSNVVEEALVRGD